MIIRSIISPSIVSDRLVRQIKPKKSSKRKWLSCATLWMIGGGTTLILSFNIAWMTLLLLQPQANKETRIIEPIMRGQRHSAAVRNKRRQDNIHMISMTGKRRVRDRSVVRHQPETETLQRYRRNSINNKVGVVVSDANEGREIRIKGRPVGDPCHNNSQIEEEKKKKEEEEKDHELDQCASYKLPFTPEVVPASCWPRIFLLPSYPTSGNELVHSLFEKITGLSSFHSFVGQTEAAYELSSPASSHNNNNNNHHHTGITIFRDAKLCSSGLTMPYAGRVVLSKNHFRNEKHVKLRLENFVMNPLQRTGKLGGTIHGIVRLVRNPGDQLLRNIFRWSSAGRDCQRSSTTTTIDCFLERARPYCTRASNSVEDWNLFHAVWNSYDKEVPQLLMHYEAFAVKQKAPPVFHRLILDFLHEEELEPGTLHDKVHNYVREPQYEQGTLMAKVCGVEVARKVHGKTKAFSEPLGYEFNDEKGTWRLQIESANVLSKRGPEDFTTWMASS